MNPNVFKITKSKLVDQNMYGDKSETDIRHVYYSFRSSNLKKEETTDFLIGYFTENYSTLGNTTYTFKMDNRLTNIPFLNLSDPKFLIKKEFDSIHEGTKWLLTNWQQIFESLIKDYIYKVKEMEINLRDDIDYDQELQNLSSSR